MSDKSAILNNVFPFYPHYYHREYLNDLTNNCVGNKIKDIKSFFHEENLYESAGRITRVALPFLALTSLSRPISLGMGAVRVWTSANKLISDLHSNKKRDLSLDFLQTVISVAAFVASIFAHPIGIVVTTSQDIIFELKDLVDAIEKNDKVAALVSITKIINNSLYLALICCGGLELSIASYTMQAIMLVISSVDDFKKGNKLEAYGNLLLSAVRGNQAYSQFKILQRKWEIEAAIKRVFVGELHEKWQFPSDHLPVGVEVNGVKIISWNVLNNAYLDWITVKDSQGLNGSMISELNKEIPNGNGLTQRDLLIADMVVSMTKSGHIVALQECSLPFLEVLQTKLPESWGIMKSFARPVVNQDVILYNASELWCIKSEVPKNVFPSAIGKPVQNLVFLQTKDPSFSRDLMFRKTESPYCIRVINAHVPGDPKGAGKEDFAKYVSGYCHAGEPTTVALGDYNFERGEMISAFQRFCNKFDKTSLHTLWKSNIDPECKFSKAIDHIFIGNEHVSRDLEVEEVLPGGYHLKETIDLLNGA